MKTKQVDVAVLGSGMGGSVLAAVLARHGLNVLILERGSHPRFAIGESLLPQATVMFRIIGERYDVPEIQSLGQLSEIDRHISPCCGLKRGLGFVYHQAGRPHNPKTCHLMVPPITPLTSESHLFREEIDAYLVKVAIDYGADYRERTQVEDLQLQSDGVKIKTEGEEYFQARYLVDGSGHNSLLAKKLGLRIPQDKLQTRTRSIFTHMQGVPPYGDLLPRGQRLHMSADWHQGTLHHIFDGGWIWVIPFNNRDASQNPLCSVGVTLDIDAFPPSSATAEEEFRNIIRRYPTVAHQFSSAKPVRDWVATGRLQYGSTHAVGERFCLLSHSYGFVDPLFSRGMIHTAEVINSLAHRLIDALRDDDFAPERFAYIDHLQKSMLQHTDHMVAGAYVSFGDFDMWNAWLRMWLLSKIYGDFRLFRTWLNYLSSGDKQVFAQLENDPAPGTACPSITEIQSLMGRAAELATAVTQGKQSHAEAATAIIKLFENHAALLPPGYLWTDHSARHLDFTPDLLERMLTWGKTQAPVKVRERLFDFDPAPLLRSLPGAAVAAP